MLVATASTAAPPPPPPPPPLASSSEVTLYSTGLSVFHSEALKMGTSWKKRCVAPGGSEAELLAAPTSAPPASYTLVTSVKAAGAARPLNTSVCGMTTAAAAVCGPSTPSGPEAMAPVMADGANTPQGTMHSASAMVSVVFLTTPPS